MYKLTFNTATKSVSVSQDEVKLFDFVNIPTVKIESNFYEVIQKDSIDGKSKPVLRLPIIHTVMIINH